MLAVYTGKVTLATATALYSAELLESFTNRFKNKIWMAFHVLTTRVMVFGKTPAVNHKTLNRRREYRVIGSQCIEFINLICNHVFTESRGYSWRTYCSSAQINIICGCQIISRQYQDIVMLA